MMYCYSLYLSAIVGLLYFVILDRNGVCYVLDAIAMA